MEDKIFTNNEKQKISKTKLNMNITGKTLRKINLNNTARGQHLMDGAQ